MLSVLILLVSAFNQSENATARDTTQNSSMNILPVEGTPLIESGPTGAVTILPVDPPIHDNPTNSSHLELPVEQPSQSTAEEINPPIEEESIPLPSQPNTISTFLNLIIDKLTAFAGEVINIQALLTYQNASPIANQKVDFYVNELLGSNITNEEGKASLVWNTSVTVPDSYIILANYSGDSEYGSSSAEVNLLLENIPPQLSVEAVIPPVAKQHVLAKVFDQDNLEYDREYAQKYLSLRHNFSDLPYKEVSEREDFSLTMRNKPNDVGGFSINNSRFAVQVVYCDGFAGFCKFRINGVLTPQLYFPEKLNADRTDSFNLDGNYVLSIKSAQFNLCDNHRFCHFGYEGYDVIGVAVRKK